MLREVGITGYLAGSASVFPLLLKISDDHPLDDGSKSPETVRFRSVLLFVGAIRPGSVMSEGNLVSLREKPAHAAISDQRIETVNDPKCRRKNRMRLLNCIVYMALLGILCFPLGRLLARISFRTDKFPFRLTRAEKNGELYKKLKIHEWKSRIPDISRLFPKIVPQKQFKTSPLDARFASLMVNETCVAELVHDLLILCGLVMLFIWPGTGGIAVTAVYILFGNLPFVLVQRYNRPRFIRVRDALLKREQLKKEQLK